jgi:hypothetical protein
VRLELQNYVTDNLYIASGPELVWRDYRPGGDSVVALHCRVVAGQPVTPGGSPPTKRCDTISMRYSNCYLLPPRRCNFVAIPRRRALPSLRMLLGSALCAGPSNGPQLGGIEVLVAYSACV